MAYPPAYARLYNFNTDDATGLESPAPAKVDAELDAIQETVTDIRRVVRAVTTSDGRLKPSQPVNASAVEVQDVQEETAAGGTPETITFTTAIDTDYTDVHVYLNGVLQLSTDVTVTNTAVALNTTVGDSVVIHFFGVEDSALTQLADDTDNTVGAGLVGYADESGYGTQVPITGSPADVAEALDLVLNNIKNLGDIFLPSTQWVRADGTQELTADWDVGGTYTLTNVPESSANGEVVVHEQLQSLTTSVANLSSNYVATNGSSTMSGNLDLDDNLIINLDAATASGHAVEYDQLNTALALKLSLDGSLAMTGDLDMGSNSITNLADGVDDTDAATVGQVDTAIASAISTASPSSIQFLAAGVAPDSTSSTADTATITAGNLGAPTTHLILPVPGYDSWGWTVAASIYDNAYTAVLASMPFAQLVLVGDYASSGRSGAWLGNLVKIVEDTTTYELYFDQVDIYEEGDVTITTPTSPLSIVKLSSTWVTVASIVSDINPATELGSIEVRAGAGVGGLQFRVSAENDSSSDTSVSRVAMQVVVYGEAT